MIHGYFFTGFWILLLLSGSSLHCQAAAVNAGLYVDEQQAQLNRGLIALPLDAERVFLTWRLLPGDKPGTTFEIWRREEGGTTGELLQVVRTDRTAHIDKAPRLNAGLSYVLKTLDDAGRETLSTAVKVGASAPAGNALVFDIGQAYQQARVVPGDLDGDGELEVIVMHANFPGVDPSPKIWRPSEDSLKITAFEHSGEKLWSRDLGRGIEAGKAYAPLVVWDIDADGRAEIVLKTNEGNDPRNYANERLTILNGATGEVLRQAAWPPIDNLGTDYNSNSRNFIGIAHLDGLRPTIIAARGLYHAQVLWAYDAHLNLIWKRYIGQALGTHPSFKDRLLKYWRADNTAERLWSRYSGKYLPRDEYRASHSLPIADIDGDGREEILWGELCLGAKGQTLWKITERMPYPGQPDVVFPADIVPSIEGQEILYAREGWLGEEGSVGVLLVDNRGRTIWGKWDFTHVDGGWAANLIADRDDMQIFAFDLKSKEGDKAKQYGFVRKGLQGYVWDSEGRLISDSAAAWVNSNPIDWDGDGVKEICLKDGNLVTLGGDTIARLGKGVKWGADLFGDHRDEIVAAPKDGRIYIYFNTAPLAGKARLTKLVDRQYRNDLSRTAVNNKNIPNESGIILRK